MRLSSMWNRLLCLGLLALSLQAQIISVETREVLVDVSVTGRKDTAPLTAKDFSITEDGKPQKINSVSAGASDPDRSQKHFVLMFDFAALLPEDQAASEKAAVEFVEGMASPDRYMAVVVLNAAGASVVQNFTTAKEALKKAVAIPISAGLRSSGDLTGALSSTCRSMAAAPDRKVILLFTQYSLRDERLFEPVATECNRANVAVDTVWPRGSLSSSLASQARPSMPSRPTIGNGVLIGGTPDPEAASALAEYLAKTTGGEAFGLTGDLSAQLATMARTQDENYRIAYTPPPAKEGSCHKLKVTTAVRATIQARNEYCTEKAVDVVAGKIAGQGLESRAGTGNLTASMQLPYFYTGTNRASVHLALDVMPAGMKFEKSKTGFHGQIDIVGTTLRGDGGTAARFADTVDIDLADQQQVDTFVKTPWHYEHPFTAAAGTYNFQLAVGAGPNAVAKVEAPLTIEPWNSSSFGASALALSTVLHPVDESAAGGGLTIEGKGSLRAGGRELVVAAVKRFRKADPLYFYLEIYAPGVSEGLTLQYRILDAKTGEVRADSGLGSISGFIRPGNPVIPFATRLDVTQIPAGFWRLEVRASGPPGDASATRSIDFELN